MPRRPSLPLLESRPVGAYRLLRLAREEGDAGVPGQFFMAQADPAPAAAYLPRALSATWADERELAFLLDVRGAGTRALLGARRVSLLGPLGQGFALTDGPAVVVAGGIGAAIAPWLARAMPQATVLLGFRSAEQAACAELLGRPATVVLDPVLVTEPLARLLPRAAAGTSVYACGPEPMLRAVAALCAEHAVPCQLALEAAMACGYGACYGCAVRIDGAWKRLCVEGPVLGGERVLA